MKIGEIISYQVSGINSWRDAEIVHIDASLSNSIFARDVENNKMLFLSPQEIQ